MKLKMKRNQAKSAEIRRNNKLIIFLRSFFYHKRKHVARLPKVLLQPAVYYPMNNIDPQPSSNYCIDFQDVLDASTKIKDIARKTPVMTCSSLDHLANNRRLFFKVEALQRTGSFKFRGALNAILSLMDDVENKNEEVHVVTHSSGNHAAAVALAARLASEKMKRKVEATIVMPDNAPLIKVNGVKGFGGNIVFVESTNEAREIMADKIVDQKGAVFIHPSEDKRVIAGQGTVCIEFVEQVREMIGFVGGDLDAVIIPVGGGGLAAGNAVALRGLLGSHVKVRLAY
jgi:threonine dehydratase